MTGQNTRIAALTSETFAGVSDHVRLPSRFHARLSAISSLLPR